MGWDVHPELLITVRRDTPFPASQGHSSATEVRYEVELSTLGPLFCGVQDIAVWDTDDAGTVLTMSPKDAKAGDWHVAVLAGYGSGLADAMRSGDIWNDARLEYFFSTCFAPAS